MPALSCARHWRRDPAGTAHVCEALFPRASWPLRSYTVTLLCRRGHMAGQAYLLSTVTCRTSATSDSCSRRCSLLARRLVVRWHLSTNSALLIDRSAEPVQSSLLCSWQTLAPLHAGTRLATFSCRTREHARCDAPVKKGLVVILVGAPSRLISNFTSRFTRSCHRLERPSSPSPSARAAD